MKKYLLQLRRGIRYVDETGATLLENNIPVRDDWTSYTNKTQNEYRYPQDGELVAEFEVMFKNGKQIKTTPRLKIGDGVNAFANLEYISVDSFILPTKASVTIYPDKWEQMTGANGEVIANRYVQYVTVDNAIVTPNSQIDLQPTPQDLVVFHEKDLTFVAINNQCTVRVCLIGIPPSQEYTFMATVTELADVTTDEIVGNTTATPNPKPDWEQIDTTKADYIKNKPTLGELAGKSIIEWTDLSEDLKETLANIGSGSTNDYTDEDKNKLAGIEAGAEVNVQSDWAQNDTGADDYIKNKPTLGAMAAKSTVAKTDLTDDVKASLDKADSAIQSLAGYATEKFVEDAVGGIAMPDANEQIEAHNTATEAHNDIRLLITELTNRLNAVADSDDEDLDQLHEIVAYIKSNKSLIDAITTSKVNVSDIINNLTTNVANKPLSAAQGVALKALIDAITVPTKVSELTNDKGYLTSYTESDPTVPAWAKSANKPTYTASEVGAASASDLASVQTQLNKKADDYSIEIYNGTSGNPKPVRFASFNYSECTSEAGIAAKISMVSGHGNGSSYAFMQDAIIRVTFQGSVSVDNFKYYGAEAGTYDGAARQYGDIFWLVDTENKIVDFYCLMGQYARMNSTPWKRLTYSDKGTVTQHTSATVYSSGTMTWANNSDIALISDLLTNLEAYLSKSGGTMTGSIDFSNPSSWITPYLMAFKNADPNSNPVYPYTGFYQWGDMWEVNARDANNTWAKKLIMFNLVSGIADFGARPTVNSANVAMQSEVPKITSGTADLTAGSSALETGALYFVYE